MIDYLNEIFNTVAKKLRAVHEGVTVIGEYTRKPPSFPCVTLDEIQNVAVDSLEDSSGKEQFAAVTYRLQVFSNKASGKKAQAREIFKTADAALYQMGFLRATYTTTPEIYESTVYSITATYEGVISTPGYVFKRP